MINFWRQLLNCLISFWNKCWISAFWINTKETMYLLLVLWFFPYLSVKLTILLGQGNLRSSLNPCFWLWIICNDFDFHKQAPLNRMKTFCKHKAEGSSSLWSFKCYLGLICLVGNLGLMLLFSFCDLFFW